MSSTHIAGEWKLTFWYLQLKISRYYICILEKKNMLQTSFQLSTLLPPPLFQVSWYPTLWFIFNTLYNMWVVYLNITPPSPSLFLPSPCYQVFWHPTLWYIYIVQNVSDIFKHLSPPPPSSSHSYLPSLPSVLVSYTLVLMQYTVLEWIFS